MRIREPVVAGSFYPADAQECRTALDRLLDTARRAGSGGAPPIGGVVPHAGWFYSGAVTAKVFAALAVSQSDESQTPAAAPDVVVLFGGVHRHRGREAAMFGSGRWETPLGSANVDERLAERILGHTNLIVDDPYAHEDEHSIEVQLPFVQHLFPQVKIVPIMVPPVKRAAEVGEAVARTLTAYKYAALIVGTTDLTHYGPRYGFVSKGVGPAGNRWAKEENDRRFIDLVCELKSTQVVAEATEHKNACSSGAVAATIAACAALGASRGVVLEHTTSAEVTCVPTREAPEDSVSYAGIVFTP